MNIKAILYYLGMVLKLVAALLLIPTCISLYFQEYSSVKGFVITIGVALLCGIILNGIHSEKTGAKKMRPVYSKDSLVLVALCWLCISFFGALPYYISGAIPSFVDSLFESVSGLTTTGASILTNVEALPFGLLFWRSFTHWIGGMGVLVFLLAASSGEHSVYVMKAESPGPTPGKLVPRLRQSALILYSIYIALTLLQVIFLYCGGMPLYDSFCCALSTAGTGGFHIKNASMAFYDNAYYELVTAFFMVLFGINFNMIYFLLIRNFKAIWKSEEFRVYIGIVAGSTIAITLNLLHSGFYRNFGTALRDSVFQVSSMITTTGFCTANFDLWPQFSRCLLMIIMVIGASAGSTGGGIKVSRIIILCKEAKRNLLRTANPRSVGIVTLDGKTVDKQVIHTVSSFFITFCFITIVSTLLISLEGYDLESTFTAVLACAGNAGPGLGMVSPVGNYSEFSLFSKLLLAFNMLVGRLEIYPMLILFSSRTWQRV